MWQHLPAKSQRQQQPVTEQAPQLGHRVPAIGGLPELLEERLDLFETLGLVPEHGEEDRPQFRAEGALRYRGVVQGRLDQAPVQELVVEPRELQDRRVVSRALREVPLQAGQEAVGVVLQVTPVLLRLHPPQHRGLSSGQDLAHRDSTILSVGRPRQGRQQVVLVQGTYAAILHNVSQLLLQSLFSAGLPLQLSVAHPPEPHVPRGVLRVMD